MLKGCKPCVRKILRPPRRFCKQDFMMPWTCSDLERMFVIVTPRILVTVLDWLISGNSDDCWKERLLLLSAKWLDDLTKLPRCVECGWLRASMKLHERTLEYCTGIFIAVHRHEIKRRRPWTQQVCSAFAISRVTGYGSIHNFCATCSLPWHRHTVKPGFHCPSWRPESTVRVDGWSVSVTRQHDG